MKRWLTRIYNVPRRTIIAFIREARSADAAALAYYAIFSFPPLVFIAVWVAAMVFDRRAVVGTIYLELSRTLGETTALIVVENLTSAQNAGVRGGMEKLLSLLVLSYTATGAFAQLQASLNRIWEVPPDPGRANVRKFLVKRIASLGMVVSLGFLLMVSLLLSAALTGLGGLRQNYLPSGISYAFVEVLHEVISLLVFAVLFALIYRVLPDAQLRWKDAALGGLITSFVFSVGRILLALYLANTDVTTAYGVETSLIIVLLWIYCASIMVLLGAGLTRSLAVENEQMFAPPAVEIPPTPTRFRESETESTK